MPKIQCVSCKKIIGVTTDKFNPDIRPNGSMLDLAEPYKSRGWGQMMNWTIGTCCSELFCPLCNYPLAPSGRFTLLEEPVIIREMSQAEKNQAVIESEWQVINESFITNLSEVFGPALEKLAENNSLEEMQAVTDEYLKTHPEEKSYSEFGKSDVQTVQELSAEVDDIIGLNPISSCPKCGKLESEFKNRSGFVNHCRKCTAGGGK